jgi:hypothetical protein
MLSVGISMDRCDKFITPESSCDQRCIFVMERDPAYRQQDKGLDPVGHRVKVVLLGRLEPLFVVLDVPRRPTRSWDLSASRSEQVDTGAFEEVPRDSGRGVRGIGGSVGHSVENTRSLYDVRGKGSVGGSVIYGWSLLTAIGNPAGSAEVDVASSRLSAGSQEGRSEEVEGDHNRRWSRLVCWGDVPYSRRPKQGDVRPPFSELYVLELVRRLGTQKWPHTDLVCQTVRP